ncbi:MAG: lipoate--protein ligase family protein [Vicinamibacterales bacterium]
MDIPGIIMHQSIEVCLSPRDHLVREWELFQFVEAGTGGRHYRIWEASRPVVVVGRSCRLADQVNQDACEADRIDVLHRCSGGGAVVLAPGCLNYAIALSLVSRPELTEVISSFRFILGQIARSLSVPGLSIAADTDLVLNGRKVSGNAQRRGRCALLHHGTLLHRFDPRLAVRYLEEPARQPAYRAARQHSEFIGNLPLSAATLRARLEAALSCVGTEHVHGAAEVAPDDQPQP